MIPYEYPTGPYLNYFWFSQESLEDIMINSESYSERLWSWLGWRTNVGDAIRPHFETYIEMKNKWAQVNGFDDYGQYWRSDYEMENDNFNDLGNFCFHVSQSVRIG